MRLFRTGKRPVFDPVPHPHAQNARIASLEQQLVEKDGEIRQLNYQLADLLHEAAKLRWAPAPGGRVVRLFAEARPNLRVVGGTAS